MKSNLLKTFFFHSAEEIAPASEINLWPEIQAHFSSHHSVLPQSTGGFKMKQSFRKAAVIFPVVLAMMLAVGFLALTPKGQTLAQQFISLFFNKEPDIRPFDPDNGTPVIIPIASIAEGEVLTGWHIYQPSWLPEGFALNGMDYRPNNELVAQSYSYQKTIGMVSSYFYIGQRKTPLNDLWPVGESSQIETVKIGDVTGEYLIGAWGGAEDHLEWEPIPQFQHLRWQQKGTYFDMAFSMFGIDGKDLPTSPYYLTKKELIDIAASMK